VGWVTVEDLYTLENARKFKWSSITADLNPERVALLESSLTGANVLDVGCGGGGYVRFLKARGMQAAGVDLHQVYLDVARENDPDGTYLQADIIELPIPDKAFDCSICFDILEHVDDDHAAVKELVRVTRKRLIVAVPRENEEIAQYNLTFLHYQDKTHLRNYTRESLAELFDGCGLTNYTIRYELAVPLGDLFKATIISEKSSSRIIELVKKYVPGFQPFKRAKFIKIYTGLTAVIDL